MTESKSGNLVLKSKNLIMAYLAWIDIGNRLSEEESYTHACNKISFY